MLKLTRLNQRLVAINPDHVSWIDVSPDTTLCLIGGDKIIVRETLDELLDQLVAFRQLVRAVRLGDGEGEPAALEAFTEHVRTSLLASERTG